MSPAGRAECDGPQHALLAAMTAKQGPDGRARPQLTGQATAISWRIYSDSPGGASLAATTVISCNVPAHENRGTGWDRHHESVLLTVAGWQSFRHND
jgi:hypothetical protein